MAFKVTRSEVGYLKLSDGAIIYIRVTITDLREGELKPTGPDFGIGFQIGITVHETPEGLRERVRGKPLPPADGSHRRNLDIWELVGITEKKPAREECVQRASDGRSYRIAVEIEPTIVARTLEYRDHNGHPIYFIRWSPRALIYVQEESG